MATNKDKEISEALNELIKKLGEKIEELEDNILEKEDILATSEEEEEDMEKGSIESSQELAKLLIDSKDKVEDKVEGAQELIDIIFEPTLKLLAANKKKLGLTDIILYVGGEIDGREYCDTIMTGGKGTTSEDIMDVFATACSRALDGYGKKYKK